MSDKAAGPGGAVIVSADGSRLEIAPSSRTRTSLPELSVIPPAELAQRKTRAQAVLLASALLAFGLVFWARRYRPG